MRLLRLAGPLLLLCLATLRLPGAALSDPQVDAYNLRVGTQTFTGLYHFTPDNLLVETAHAITNMGSDTIKLYLGSNFQGRYWTNLSSTITNLWTLARNEPNCRHVFDMPFRHIIAWTYPFANSDAPFQKPDYGTNSQKQAGDYREMYDLTRYLLTNYNNSGKTFYLGHWEGDGYLNINGWTTNPPSYYVTNMVVWENTRQKGVDDARAATGGAVSNVNVFYYLEVNRVHDAIYNGPDNNVRVANCVLPYVTNLDFVSYSSYDMMSLPSSTMYAMLHYVETNTPPIPAAKAGLLPPNRLWIGEYGWGNYDEATQETKSRGYIQALLNYSNPLPFILFWEIYNNETNKLFCLIDSNHVYTPCYDLHQRFYNSARLALARFQESHGRLPTDAEFGPLVAPSLDQPFPAPVPLTVAAGNAVLLSASSAQVAGTVTQGVYGDDQATMWLFYGPQDGGTDRSAWPQSLKVGVNTNFNPATFSVVLSNLAASTTYFYRFCATNADAEAWAPVTSAFVTPTLDPAAFSARLKLTFSGYNRPEALTNFPVLVNLGPSVPGFSYRQFASPTGGDLRFTDASGTWSIPYEIDEWNTNGTSTVWVSVPRLAGPNDCIWAYWGNPLATNPPVTCTNGATWTPNFAAVFHLKESDFPYVDSTQQHSTTNGVRLGSTAGFIGKACSFDGSTQYLDLGAFDVGNAFTLSAWVNVSTSLGANGMVPIWVSKVGGWDADGFGLFVNSWNTTDKSLRLETGDGSYGVTAYSPANTINFGQWHLVTASVDRAAGSARLYLDGTDCTQSTAVWTTFATANDINLGRILGSSPYFKGALDEARIASGARSSNWVWASWSTVAANASLASYSTVTQPPPVLSFSSSPKGSVLSWPAPGVGFSLYTTTNLAPPVHWTFATNQPVLVNTQWQIVLPPTTNSVQFYRLQSQ